MQRAGELHLLYNWDQQLAPNHFIPSVLRCHNMITYSIQCLLQLRSISFFKSIHCSKLYTLAILDCLRLQHTLNAPQSSCWPTCIPCHLYQQNKVFHTNTTILVAWSRPQVLLRAFLQENQQMELQLPDESVVCNIASAKAGFFVPRYSKILYS